MHMYYKQLTYFSIIITILSILVPNNNFEEHETIISTQILYHAKCSFKAINYKMNNLITECMH